MRIKMAIAYLTQRISIIYIQNTQAKFLQIKMRKADNTVITITDHL